jgi:hypothetical protein
MNLAETAKRVNGHVESGKNGGCTPFGIGPVRFVVVVVVVVVNRGVHSKKIARRAKIPSP